MAPISNPGGTPYEVENEGIRSDSEGVGAVQRCLTVSDVFKAVTAVRDPAVHDALAALAARIPGTDRTGDGLETVLLRLHPPLAAKELATPQEVDTSDEVVSVNSDGSIAIATAEEHTHVATPTWPSLQSHNHSVTLSGLMSGAGSLVFCERLYGQSESAFVQGSLGNVNVNTRIEIPAPTEGSGYGVTAEEVRESINTFIGATPKTRLRAWSPMPSGAVSWYGPKGCIDDDSDRLLELNISEYELHLVYLTLRCYFPGIRDFAVGGSNPPICYMVNPASITVLPGSSTTNITQLRTGIERAIGMEEDFSFDEWMRDYIFGDVVGDEADRQAAYSEYVGLLEGAPSGVTSLFTQDWRVADTHWSLPIHMLIGIGEA